MLQNNETIYWSFRKKHENLWKSVWAMLKPNMSGDEED